MKKYKFELAAIMFIAGMVVGAILRDYGIHYDCNKAGQTSIIRGDNVLQCGPKL